MLCTVQMSFRTPTPGTFWPPCMLRRSRQELLRGFQPVHLAANVFVAILSSILTTWVTWQHAPQPVTATQLQHDRRLRHCDVTGEFARRGRARLQAVALELSSVRSSNTSQRVQVGAGRARGLRWRIGMLKPAT